MSPRAACRLEGLGYEVYDYVDGIADWKAAGLPTEGTADLTERVADATRPDLPTCRPDELLGEIRPRLDGWEVCAVLDCEGVVVGRIRQPALAGEGGLLVEEVMEHGPATVRPHALLQPLVDRMDRRETPHLLVTDPQGRLLGIVLREEAKRLLSGETPQQVWRDCEGCPGLWA